MVHTRIASRALLLAAMASIAGQSMAMQRTYVIEMAPQSSRFINYVPSARITAASAAAISLFLLCTRSAKPDFVARGNVREVLNVHHAVTDTRNYFTNLKDVYMDRFVGQKGKEAGLQVGANNMIVNKESCKPAGILGTIHSKIPGHDETIKILTIVGAILATKNSDALLGYFGMKKKDTPNEQARTNELLTEQNAMLAAKLRIAKTKFLAKFHKTPETVEAEFNNASHFFPLSNPNLN